MRIKDGYIVRSVAGNYIVVAVGKEALDFNGVITINETGAFLWKALERNMTKQELIKALIDEYEVDEKIATKDVEKFVSLLEEADLLV